jgi:hypothetical protein
MSLRRNRTALSLAALLAALALGACSVPFVRSGQQAAPLTATPWVVYVTATPEGYIPPTATPWVVYVTATPPGGIAPSPDVIYVTATPPPVGPFNLTPGGTTPTQQPTLDLSGVTLQALPTLAPALITATPTATLPIPTATPSPLPPTPTAVPRTEGLYSNRLGINFISSAQHETNARRFRAATRAGAGWDRFAIYWNEIEQVPNEYIWDVYDVAVRNDVLNGLRTDAILLGTPSTYANQNTWIPNNLYEPVFSDGSDVPGTGKTINPNNPWAEFVYAVVQRYKPGGLLATRDGWPSGAGIRVWEIWNEPDFRQFWRGSADEYARLLKVAYIAAHHADSEARVMLGGLVLFEQPNFLPHILNLYRDDPSPVDKRYPFDIVAVHSYSSPAFSFYAVQQTATLLAVHGLEDTPVWVNESGVAVWDDYPGPSWATRADQIIWRASMTEQASYVIANATFAFLAGADTLFHFQLYDDCGNQPRGTTFAPHDGSLCDSGAVCWGDALGLLRNRTDNVCFNQHPDAGSKRPAYDAFRTVGEVFGSARFVPLTGYPSGGRQWMVFARPNTAEIITVVWDETGIAGDVAIPARSTRATLIRWDGESQIVTPGEDGAYHAWLDAATNRNQPGNPNFMIGGMPVILIEQSPRPLVSVLPLLDASRTAALVRWRASDPAAITTYEVYYRDDTSGANEWVRWIETTEPGEELFAAGLGRRYSFFARGRLADGSWTADVPYSQAWTTLQ